MNDILLVIGSVTAAQYEPLRRAMLDRGLKPKVVRVDNRSEQFLQHIDAINESVENDYNHPDEKRLGRYDRIKIIGTREWVWLEKLESIDRRHVKAIVVDSWGDPFAEDLFSALRKKVPFYYGQLDFVGGVASWTLRGKGYGPVLS